MLLFANLIKKQIKMLSLMELSNVVRTVQTLPGLLKRCQGCSNVVRTEQTLSGLFKRCQGYSNVVENQTNSNFFIGNNV
jgi:hypothetical protein